MESTYSGRVMSYVPYQQCFKCNLNRTCFINKTPFKSLQSFNSLTFPRFPWISKNRLNTSLKENGKNGMENLLLWQSFSHSNRLSYYDKFCFEQRDPYPLQKNPKYSQQKHKIKPSMINPKFTRAAIFLKWQFKLLGATFFAQHLWSWIFTMLFCIKFRF